MPLAIPKILVVADPGEQHELVALLRGAGAPFTEAVIAAADGDDATLQQFTELRPQVVVVAATLAAGDTRALVGAMREAATRGVFIVLLGDERGPVRNALDALDFGCDRFVARPLAVKALRFAVSSGLGTAGGAGTQSGATRPAMISASQLAGGAVRVTEPMPVAGRITEEIPTVLGTGAHVATPVEADAPPTAPIRTPRAPTLSEQRARWEAMADALGTGDGLGDDEDDEEPAPAPRRPPRAPSEHEPGAVEHVREIHAEEPHLEAPQIAFNRALTGEIEVGVERTIHADPPPYPRPTVSSRFAAVEEHDDAIELTDREVDDLSVDEPSDPFREHDSFGVGDEEAEVVDVRVRSAVGDGFGADNTPPPPNSPWRPGSTDVPVAPVREPTMVISESTPPPIPPRLIAIPPPPPRSISAPPPEVELTERPGVADSSDAGGAWSAASQVAAAEDDEDVLADVAAGVDEDLSIDLSSRDRTLTREHREPELPPPPAAGAAADAPPSGGDFARELRRKMSMMAERLFRGGDVPQAAVAIGPGHDHHTEIDLRGLVDDPLIGGGGGTEVFDLPGGGATFVGGDEPEHVTNPQGTDARGTAEAGDIQRGVSDAAALIARMFAADFTGRIVFRRAGVEKVIHVEGGRPVFASSNLPHDRMGELLLREGKITAEQYARCNDLVRDTGRRMGEILVERGFLKRRELLPAVRRHVEDIIYSLFAWDTGEYRIVPGDGAASERIRLSRHPAAMVLEGVRRKIDRPTLERLVGPPAAVVETTDRDKLAAITGVADLSAEERAALAAFDGTSDLAQVARTSGAGLTNVYQLAWSLHLLGLATTRRRAGEEETDAPALVGESDLAIDRDRVRARHALVVDADYFALLGVRRDATGFEIKRAYEAARRDFAAETFPPELRRELAGELDDIAHVLDEAYRVLRDDALRGQYVAHLRDFDEAAS